MSLLLDLFKIPILQFNDVPAHFILLNLFEKFKLPLLISSIEE